MRPVPLVCLALGLAATATGQEVRRTEKADRPAPIALTLAPGNPGGKSAPRYSPPGRRVELAPAPGAASEGFDPLQATLKLGPDARRPTGITLIVARSAKGKPYDLLFVDGKVVKVAPATIRNKVWTSFETVLKVEHGPSSTDDYPVALWMVVDKETDTPDIIRVSRRGFLEGEAKIGGKTFGVVVSDSNNDGVIGKGDWWEIRPGDGMRTIGDHAWAGEQAWSLEIVAGTGRSARLVAIEPGVSREEDLAKRDRYREDRLAPRADKPIAFRRDVRAAVDEARSKGVPYFLKFETDWCGPCHTMAEFVFTARDVAQATQGLTCIVVDGDAHQDLTAEHKVTAYPTGVLFGADGREIGRYVGYRGVKDTAAFLKKRTP